MSLVPTLLISACVVMGFLTLPPIVVLALECLFAAISRRTSPQIAMAQSDAERDHATQLDEGASAHEARAHEARAQEAGARPCDLTRDVKYAVLVPAHNEQAVIGTTVGPLLRQLAPGQRLVVVADNCTDQTAEIARQEGAEVIERQDDARRGKGYALAFGIDHLRADPPDVVIVVDADTTVDDGTFAALAQQVASTGRPAQAIDVLNPPESPSVRDLISSFAFLVKNLVRPLGQKAMGAPCQLMGTGMALPWDSLQAMPLASSNLVEDLQLGIDFAVAGLPPTYCPAGRVSGDLPSCPEAAAHQRTRWEHGHMATITRQVPRLAVAAFRRRRFDLMWMACDLAVPPLALLVFLWTGWFVVSCTAWLALATLWPFDNLRRIRGRLGGGDHDFLVAVRRRNTAVRDAQRTAVCCEKSSDLLRLSGSPPIALGAYRTRLARSTSPWLGGPRREPEPRFRAASKATGYLDLRRYGSA